MLDLFVASSVAMGVSQLMKLGVLNLWPHIRMGFLLPKLKVEFGTQFVRKGGWWEQSI